MSEQRVCDWSDEWSKRDQLDGDKVIETFPPDKLDRQKYAEFLTKFLANQGHDKAIGNKHNYVLNLNSEWGSGKTYFLRRWAEDLKEHYPVVYVDAWKQDYSDDPLMTVISSMIKQLREQAGKEEDDPVFKAPRKLIGLLKAAAPGIARGLTKRYLGIDPVEIMQAEDDEVIRSEDSEGKSIDMGFAASDAVKFLINEHDSKLQAIESLKTNVEQWVEAVVGSDQIKNEQESKRTYPAFVFIDELDRCRPNYAVEMLETIKHIFDISGVVFVIATDTEQLQHAVKAVYGEGFEARTYLGRFFNSRFSLKAPSFERLLDVHCQIEKLDEAYLNDRGVTIWPSNTDLDLTVSNITTILDAFELSARTALQVTERVIVILSNLSRGKSVDIVMLTVLLCIREKDEELFEQVITDTFSKQKNGEALPLSHHLSEKFSINNKEIKLHLEPLLLTDKLRIDSMNSFENKYPSGVYFCSLFDYLGKIFVPFFEVKYVENDDYVDYFPDEGIPLVSQLESDLNELLADTKCIDVRHDSEAGFKWLEYTHLETSLNQTTSPNYYKDLVELASALDWINSEDEA
ncbi:KAP family P-loop NTPase fold protein [Photobacterium sanguinicancri]|uniref:P-loop NTPase fold protein n=1 Tax=Photobacterium sanguinicancri TaxID=875932 RepID=A0AAW7Y8L2_9GAMM|nr:P-loop NTPase fold protein [Photobacterium sanguinicancri]MDO6544290.1 P-loop NTPase fold protein [Photobacterium sanguinicancri]